MTASGGAEGVGRAVNQAVVIAFLGVFAFNYVFTQTLLATHPEIPVIMIDGRTWLAVPRDWIANFGEIVKFCGARAWARSTACASSASSARRCARPAS